MPSLLTAPPVTAIVPAWGDGPTGCEGGSKSELTYFGQHGRRARTQILNLLSLSGCVDHACTR